jgi:hypothetical protein
LSSRVVVVVAVFLAQVAGLVAFAQAQGFLLLPEQITALRSVAAALDHRSTPEA